MTPEPESPANADATEACALPFTDHASLERVPSEVVFSAPSASERACADQLVEAPGVAGRASVWRVLAFSWTTPARNARALLHVGLASAFGIHVLAGLLLVVSLIMLVPPVVGQSSYEFLGQVIDEITRWPREFLIGLSITVLVVESFAFGLALLLTPWGARDEKLRSSLYHAMRAVWLQSVGFALATTTWIVCFAAWEHRGMERWYGSDWSTRPWYIRQSDEIAGYLICGLYLWVFWTFLRAVGAREVKPPADAPPTCQGCGYNLTGSAAEGLCPECGESVQASLGPEGRPGVRWERRGDLTRRQAWWQTSWQAIRQPGVLGRETRLYSPADGHRRFMLLQMCAAGLVGLLCACAWMAGYMMTSTYGWAIANQGFDSVWEDFIWLTAPMSGIIGGLSLLALSLLFAGLMGLSFTWGSGRNALPVAMRCAAYLSGFVTLWVAANALPACVYGLSSDIVPLQVAGEWMRMSGQDLVLWLWLAFNAVWLCVYVQRFHVMLRGARYATR